MNKELQDKFNRLQQQIDDAAAPPLDWKDALELFEEIAAHCDSAAEAVREEHPDALPE